MHRIESAVVYTAVMFCALWQFEAEANFIGSGKHRVFWAYIPAVIATFYFGLTLPRWLWGKRPNRSLKNASLTSLGVLSLAALVAAGVFTLVGLALSLQEPSESNFWRVAGLVLAATSTLFYTLFMFVIHSWSSLAIGTLVATLYLYLRAPTTR